MIGQAFSLDGKKYNVIILAGGQGSRMGTQSDYIPKALSQIGNARAIDHIINRYLYVAHKFIIGIGKNGDLLQSYVLGRYPTYAKNIEFSYEETPVNNAVSTLYCLDHADSNFGTIIVFCDLIVVSNNIIHDDKILVATSKTKGKIGTFRHTDRFGNGILGHFVFSNTMKLKSIIYEKFDKLNDLTEDVVFPYGMETEECETVYEFGNENDLEEVRSLWENA